MTGEFENPFLLKSEGWSWARRLPFWRVPTNVTESAHPRDATTNIKKKKPRPFHSATWSWLNNVRNDQKTRWLVSHSFVFFSPTVKVKKVVRAFWSAFSEFAGSHYTASKRVKHTGHKLCRKKYSSCWKPLSTPFPPATEATTYATTFHRTRGFFSP